MWLDTEKDVNFSCYASVENELATCCISGIYKLYDNHKGGNSSGENRENNVTLNQ